MSDQDGFPTAPLPTMHDATQQAEPAALPTPVAEWHRLHPLSPVVRLGRGFLPLVFVLVGSWSRQEGLASAVIHVAILLVVAAIGVVSWLVTRWRVESGALRIETGLLQRNSLRFPLSRLQAVDIVQPGLARVFGLAQLQLRMAGEAGTAGSLAYLTRSEAERVRAQLLALAHGVAEDAPPPPEEVLFSLPTSRLVGSLLVSRVGFVFVVLVIGFVVTAFISWQTAIGFLFGGVAWLLGIATAIYRRFNSECRLTVADAPDGLRVRAGLVETVAETIPRGRVQAVRLLQPWLWKPFGWCRLEVDVAGRQGQKQSPSGRELRAVLPVGSVAEAQMLLHHIIADAPVARRPAPARARWKAPLRFRHLAWGSTEQCVVATSGRFGRITVWIPLAKVQSFRLLQGPVQRRLRLQSVWLDTPGSSLDAVLRDRDETEAVDALQYLVDRGRAERSSTPLTTGPASSSGTAGVNP